MEWATDGADGSSGELDATAHCDLFSASLGEGSLEGVISKTLFCTPEFLISVFGESILAIRPRLL
jgi:hypothetical protein